MERKIELSVQLTAQNNNHLAIAEGIDQTIVGKLSAQKTMSGLFSTFPFLRFSHIAITVVGEERNNQSKSEH